MKLAISIWNVSVKDKFKPISYNGYKTKKEAIQFVEDWNKKHDLQVEVIKYVDEKWNRA